MRYLPHGAVDREAMLAAIGVSSVDELFADIPKGRQHGGLQAGDLAGLPRSRSEIEVERLLSRMAARNLPAGAAPFFVGAGAYKHHVPATVDHIIQRSEFLTAYTPYQPEIAQGTLQWLFEFQSQVALLTGMDVANASMYDGSTAAAEAMLMAHRITRRSKAVVAPGLHPHYRAVIETIARLSGGRVAALAASEGASPDLRSAIDDETSCVIIQTPDVFGALHDLSGVARAAHERGALLIAVVTEAVSLGALRSPGSMGADIVAGEGQSLGNGLNFGGPYLGLLATRNAYVRQTPGRLCGETLDEDGRRSFVLTLVAREQHIRREKATSNICTSAGLCALAFSIHLSLLGETGLRRLAAVNHANAVRLADALASIPGAELVTPQFFNEFTLRLPTNGAQVIDALADRGVLGGVPASRLFPGEPAFENLIIAAATETNTQDDIEAYASALREVLK
jgi:glycine dehydrogenase subunit 1